MLTEQHIVEEIKKRRLQLGWSQQELSVKSGVSRTHISNIEKGRFFPTLSTLEQIMKPLRMKLVIKIS